MHAPRCWLVSVLLTTAPLAAQTTVQHPLQHARPLGRVEAIAEHVAAAPDGTCVAVLDAKRQVALLVDGETGSAHELTTPRVTAIALAARANPVWLGDRDGRIHRSRWPAQEEVEPLCQPCTTTIDRLAAAPGAIAWSSAAARRIGVVDASTGESLWSTTIKPGRDGTQLAASRDGRHLAAIAQREGQDHAVLFETRTGREVLATPTYLAHRPAALAFTGDGLCTATRLRSNQWQLVRHDLVTMQRSVLDEDLRGGHFVDLLASPHSALLLEGDFEEPGASLYATGAATTAPPQKLGGEGTVPVGFVQGTGTERELVMTTAGTSRSGLSAWSAATGELLAADLPIARGKRVTQVGSLLGGRRLWFCWWDAPKGDAVVRHLELCSTDQ